MSTPSKRRLIRDFKRLTTDPPGGISGAPCADNLMVWNAVIFGPADTPFEDGTFKLLLTFDESYPNKPPTVKFLSRMFHPNVYANGELCLDILQNRWSPTYDVAAILTSIQSLLHDPNPNSPANVEAANLYKDDRKQYERRVKATVEESWLDDDELSSVAAAAANDAGGSGGGGGGGDGDGQAAGGTEVTSFSTTREVAAGTGGGGGAGGATRWDGGAAGAAGAGAGTQA